jgi:hypothetical protein
MTVPTGFYLRVFLKIEEVEKVSKVEKKISKGGVEKAVYDLFDLSKNGVSTSIF